VEEEEAPAPAPEEEDEGSRRKKEKKEKKAKKEVVEEDEAVDDAPQFKPESAAALSQAQYEKAVAERCAALRKERPELREFRCARWTVEEKLGVKFLGPDDLQIIHVSDGAAERFLDEESVGMTLTHVDGNAVRTVAEVRDQHGNKLAFRWTLAPNSTPLPKMDPSKELLTEKVYITGTADADGKTYFTLKVTRVVVPGHLGPQVKVELSKRYSEFDELRKAFVKDGITIEGFPEKTLTKCTGQALEKRRKDLDAWLTAAFRATKERQSIVPRLNAFLAEGSRGGRDSPQSPR